MNMTYGTYRKLGADPFTAFRMAHPVLFTLIGIAIGFGSAEVFKWWLL